MTNKELLDKIRNEILHLKMKELQRTNGINTGADVYLSSYAVLSIISNALTEESEDERIRKWLVEYFGSIKETVWIHRDITCEQILEWLEKQKEQKELPLMDGNADLYFDEWNQQKQNPTKRQCFEEGIRYARRLQKEQKPVVTHGETYHVDTLGTQQVIAGKMPQKPAWSEEDVLTKMKYAGSSTKLD